ncbi:MAG: FtsQ-type POTRA domain-containing protein [Ruminococcus sp.]|nr:FtsQ-type POTRA domain-containing protein [Ruminococcus sp.]
MQERGKAKNGRYASAAVRHGRRRNTVNLYVTIAAAVVAALATLLCVTVLFNLSNTGLTVSGTTLYAPEQVQSVAGLVPGQNLVRLNTDFIAARIKENLPYVDDVTIVKNYPDSLTINITEAVAQFQIEQDGLYYTISSSGRILEAEQSERDEELTLVVGYELKNTAAGDDAESEDSQKTETISEIMTQLEELEYESIEQIDITDRTDIVLSYDGRIEIKLGSSVDIDIKLSYIKAVLDSSIPESYEGTLKYNGIDSGISAIPKEETVATTPVSSDSLSESEQASDSYSEYSYDSSSSDSYSEYSYDSSYAY